MNIQDKEAALWHAFDTLDDQRMGNVPKSKLKVLSQNLGMAYGVEGLDILIDDTVEGNNLSFREFSKFLEENLFAVIYLQESAQETTALDSDLSPLPPRKRSLSNITITSDKLHDICWMLCGKIYKSRDRLNTNEPKPQPTDSVESNVITQKSTQILWQIFCFLAERDSEQCLLIPVSLDVQEVKFVCTKYLEITGQSYRDIEQTTAGDKTLVDFSSFLVTFMANCWNGMTLSDVEVGVIDLHEMFVKDTLKKGVLQKKGNHKAYSGWNDRYFILTPKQLIYYTTTVKRDFKGEINIQPDHSTAGLPDKFGNKSHRISYYTENRVYEMGAPDLKTKNEWIAVLKIAIANSKITTSYQRLACDNRRKLRQDARKKYEDAEKARIEEDDRIRAKIAEMETEKDARGKAMLKLKEEAEIRDVEQRRLEDMAIMKREELEKERTSRELSEKRLQEEAEQKLRELESKMTSDIELEKQSRELSEQRLQEEAKQKFKELESKMISDIELEKQSREISEQKLHEAAEQKLKELESKMISDIELEKQAREEAENKLNMEEALRLAEEEQLKDLREMNERLQMLLIEEQEARKDEEIVRCLQSRLLEEEFQKTENMEKIQKEMSEQFEAERLKSEGLEQEKSKRDEELSLAMDQQRILEHERLETEKKMAESMKKLQEAERKRMDLESKIKKRATPIGLARPIQVEARPLVTHRGHGAFAKPDM